MNWLFGENGSFSLYHGETLLFRGSAQAEHVDGRRIDTRTARFLGKKDADGETVLTYASENGLVLTETLTLTDGVPGVKCALSAADGSPVETRRLIPLVANGNDGEALRLWSDLFAKMLLIPYDNDTWNRYEAVPLRVGRTSYDVTVILNEETREGLLFAAIDYDDWKNALVIDHTATRHLKCISGIADEQTRDVCPHGTLVGPCVESSRFIILYGPDYRALLERFGQMLYAHRKPLQWTEGVPFGFNAFAGLARKMSNEVFERTAKFMREELLPRGFQNNGFVYTNLDGGWQRLDGGERRRIKDEMHACGQKAGLYDGPFTFHPRMEGSFDAEIPGCPGHTFNEMMLRDERGELLPPVDGLYALDVTHPLWRAYTKQKVESYAREGYDYWKIDFLSHGAMEGVHYDPSVRTGRQAIAQGYAWLEELISPEHYGRPLFLSISLAPLFPYGHGHGRRACCDTFGTDEYIEYELNAQTFGWWINRSLYDCNDPDHLVLLNSFNIRRDSTEGEARARYTTGVISGALMLLSDDYDRPEARERALCFATNREANDIARSRVAFRPAESGGVSAAHVYTARIGDEQYAAVFSWKPYAERITLSPDRAGIPCGKYRDIWTGRVFDCGAGPILWDTEGCDALLLKLEK